MKKLLLYRLSLFITCFMNSAIVYCNEPAKVEKAKERSAIDKVIRTEGTNFYGQKVISYLMSYNRINFLASCIGGTKYIAVESRIEGLINHQDPQEQFDCFAKLWHEQNNSTEKKQ